MSTGWFGRKIYLLKNGQEWELRELNAFHLLVRSIVAVLTLGLVRLYGTLAIEKLSQTSESIIYPKDTPLEVKFLYEDLMRKLLGTYVWTDALARRTLPVNLQQILQRARWDAKDPANFRKKMSHNIVIEQVLDTVNRLSWSDHRDGFLSVLEHESRVFGSALREKMEQYVAKLAKEHYLDFFSSIEYMNDQQRSSLLKLLAHDTQLSLGIWNGVMVHAKSFQFSTREAVRLWVPGLIRALTTGQFHLAVKDAKFWEVIGLFADDVGPVLTVVQWKILIDHNAQSDLLGNILIKLPVDDQLFDKLEIACGKIHLDHSSELQLMMMISNVRRFQKKCGDTRSVQVLMDAIKQGPRRKVARALPKPNYHGAMFSKPIERSSTQTIDTQVFEPVNVVLRKSCGDLCAVTKWSSQWSDEQFALELANAQFAGRNHEDRERLLIEMLHRDPVAMPQDTQNIFYGSLKILCEKYTLETYGQITFMTPVMIRRFVQSLNRAAPQLIVGVWDALFKLSAEVGESNVLHAHDVAREVFASVTVDQLQASANDHKMWAAFGAFSDHIQLVLSVDVLTVLAPYLKTAKTLPTLIAKLPRDNQLAKKLLVLAPYVVLDHQVELQLRAKLIWLENNGFQSEAREIQAMITGHFHQLTKKL